MQRYFRVTPPSVHQLVVRLTANGLIEREPGVGRSIRLLLYRRSQVFAGTRARQLPRESAWSG